MTDTNDVLLPGWIELHWSPGHEPHPVNPVLIWRIEVRDLPDGMGGHGVVTLIHQSGGFVSLVRETPAEIAEKIRAAVLAEHCAMMSTLKRQKALLKQANAEDQCQSVSAGCAEPPPDDAAALESAHRHVESVGYVWTDVQDEACRIYHAEMAKADRATIADLRRKLASRPAAGAVVELSDEYVEKYIRQLLRAAAEAAREAGERSES